MIGDEIRIMFMINSRLQSQASGSQTGSLRCCVDGGTEMVTLTNPPQDQRRALVYQQRYPCAAATFKAFPSIFPILFTLLSPF